LFIGQTYTLTYTPDTKTTGSSVASVVTNAPGMAPNISSTKKVSASILVELDTNSVSFEFDRNRFIDMAGKYNAVFTADVNNPTFANSRYFNMNLSKTRTVSGYLLDNAKVKTSFSHITFGADGSAVIPIGGITISGSVIWNNSEDTNSVKQFVGTATDGSWTAPVIADLADKSTMPTENYATMEIPSTNGVPGASGGAYVKAKGGTVSVSYLLADDNKHANGWAMTASRSGNLPQWVITKAGGLLFGTLNASNSLANLSGTQMTWIRPAANLTYPGLLPSGFVNSPFAVVSSPYDNLTAFSGTLTVTTTGDAGSNVFNQPVSFSLGKATPAGLVTAGSLKNGVLKITFMDGGPLKHKTTAVGTLLENTTNGVGFYIKSTSSTAPGTMTATP
jgi:hypothetical protein